MYLSVHPLERIVPPHFLLSSSWPADIVSLLPGEPLARWTGIQAGSSSGSLIAAWATQDAATRAADCEGTGRTRGMLCAGTTFTVEGAQLMAGREQRPAVVELVWFDGPRTAAHVQAQEIAGRRIMAAVRDLPGLCAAVHALGAQNAQLTAVFADSEETIEAAVTRLMATELGPDEDPALLPGPDRVRVCRIVDQSGSLDVLATPESVAGGVR